MGKLMVNSTNEEFDMTLLQTRISEVKKSSEEMADFIQNILECLVNRHNLANVVYEELIFPDIPKNFSMMLMDGVIPSKEQLIPLDEDSLDFMIKYCVLLCGLEKIRFLLLEHDKDGSGEEIFSSICSMTTLSPGHELGCYVLCALTLLFSSIPSYEFVSSVTNNFDSSEENMNIIRTYFNEICISIMNRYIEDKNFYG